MRGLLSLLSALLLLESTDGNAEYDRLSQHDTAIIDKAIQQANEKYGETKHLDFASVLDADSNSRMLHVLLKPTSCDKMTPYVHQKDCKIQEKARPQISCVDCRESMSCFPLKEVKKIKENKSECLNPSRKHYVGAVHLFLKTENGQQTGCLGCI